MSTNVLCSNSAMQAYHANNQRNQKAIVQKAIESRQKDMTYGQLVAKEYLEQNKIIRRW